MTYQEVLAILNDCWNTEKCKSSHRRFSFKKGVLKYFANFARKRLCWSLILEKKLIKKRFQRKCFSVQLSEFLRTSILKNIWEGLLLKIELTLVTWICCLKELCLLWHVKNQFREKELLKEQTFSNSLATRDFSNKIRNRRVFSHHATENKVNLCKIKVKVCIKLAQWEKPFSFESQQNLH